jgi:hypothetical protein
MKLPKYLWAVIIIFPLLCILGLALRIFCKIQILKDIANVSLIITLVVVSIYVYYTYMLAKDSWRSIASFSLSKDKNDGYTIIFSLKNYSKNSIECWCNLNATVNGEKVDMGGYYSGQHSWKLQPFSGGSGNFKIQDILEKAGFSIDFMEQNTKKANIKERLYLKIDFWYNTIGINEKINNPVQSYYYDFYTKEIILDV